MLMLYITPFGNLSALAATSFTGRRMIKVPVMIYRVIVNSLVKKIFPEEKANPVIYRYEAGEDTEK